MDRVVRNTVVKIRIGKIVPIFVIGSGRAALIYASGTRVISDRALRGVGVCAEIMPAVVNRDVVVDEAVVIDAARIAGPDQYAGVAVFEGQIVDQHHLRSAVP